MFEVKLDFEYKNEQICVTAQHETNYNTAVTQAIREVVSKAFPDLGKENSEERAEDFVDYPTEYTDIEEFLDDIEDSIQQEKDNKRLELEGSPYLLRMKKDNKFITESFATRVVQAISFEAATATAETLSWNDTPWIVVARLDETGIETLVPTLSH